MNLKNKKFFLTFILMVIFTLPHPSLAESTGALAGFVKASIWYSKDPFFEGDKIKIYSFVFNPDPRTLEGRVIFLDNGVLLGKTDFVASPNSVKNVSIDWLVTAGDHSIVAKIENSRFVETNGKYRDVYLLDNETEESERTVPKTVLIEEKKEVNLKAQATNKGAVGSDASLPEVSVSKIVDTVVDITPEFIATPVISGANKLEEVRESINIATIKKQESLKKEIIALEQDENKNAMAKPLAQVKIFFLSIFAFIFGHKFFFYVFWVVIILLLIRFVRRQFF